jgi:hypothetical protein
MARAGLESPALAFPTGFVPVFPIIAGENRLTRSKTLDYTNYIGILAVFL